VVSPVVVPIVIIVGLHNRSGNRIEDEAAHVRFMLEVEHAMERIGMAVDRSLAGAGRNRTVDEAELQLSSTKRSTEACWVSV
jgi:hypothetical protein